MAFDSMEPAIGLKDCQIERPLLAMVPAPIERAPHSILVRVEPRLVAKPKDGVTSVSAQ